jgi:predicted S18 family serine protease
MSVNTIVFNNASDSSASFNISNQSGTKLASISAAENSQSTGTVSGASVYQGSFTLNYAISTPQFTGDTEVTLALFIQPITTNDDAADNAETVKKEDC